DIADLSGLLSRHAREFPLLKAWFCESILARGNRLRLQAGRPGAVDAIEPGRRTEPLEDLPSFGQEERGVLAAVLAQQPLAMLEQDYRQMERQIYGPQASGGGGEVGVGSRIVALEQGMEAVGSRAEERRPQPYRETVENGEQLLRFVPVA